MGDRSPASIIVYDCPPQQAPALLKVIRAYFTQIDWDGAAPDDELLIATTAYTEHEMNLGIVQEISPLMIEAAPGATFAVTSDPYFDSMGDLFMYDPTIGSTWLSIDGSGNVAWNLDEINKFIQNQPSGFGASNLALMKAFRKAMGGDYYDRQDALTQDVQTSGNSSIPVPKEA